MDLKLIKAELLMNGCLLKQKVQKNLKLYFIEKIKNLKSNRNHYLNIIQTSQSH